MVNYQNKCKLIRGWDDLFTKCREHMNSVAAMKLSPYYRVMPCVVNVCVRICIYVCIFVCLCVCVVCVRAHMHMRVHVFVCMYYCMHTCVCMCLLSACVYSVSGTF